MGMVFLSVLLKVVGVIAVIVGVSVSLWSLLSGDRSDALRIYAIVDIGISFLVGIGFYSFGEVVGYLIGVGESKARGEGQD